MWRMRRDVGIGDYRTFVMFVEMGVNVTERPREKSSAK